MAQTAVDRRALAPASGGRSKFLVGGLLIVAAVIFLIVTTLRSSAQFFLTVDEATAQSAEIVGRNLRVSGAVLGDTIEYDPQTFTIRFEIAHIAGSNREISSEGGLAEALYRAVNNPNAARMTVLYHGVKPDLLQHEAQAIVTGRMGDDGIFYADELLLKCPTRYEEAIPVQAEG
jgi:cytochrome c-type biogenesis protein CcmE